MEANKKPDDVMMQVESFDDSSDDSGSSLDMK